MVNNGKLFVGQKLCIYGADLVGSDDACSPLEVISMAEVIKCIKYENHLLFGDTGRILTML